MNMKESGDKKLKRGFFTLFFLAPIILILQIPIGMFGGMFGAYLVYSRQLPEIPDMNSYQPKTVSTFYADDGTVIGVFFKQKRFVVDLIQIPKHVIQAFLAAEDAHFYEHEAVDWHGILRAMVRNLAAGRITQGGSTITMQVTRNFLLSRERTFSRKFKEIILAYRLEKAWGKDKILDVYLNEIYLGDGCYGVEAAARGYFDKPVEHLSVAEAALIAGLVASPARFNPFKSEELARQRQLTVLGRMLKAGFINEAQYQKAKKEPLTFRKEVVKPLDLAPDFTEVVRRYIIRKYGEEKLYNDGLKVFTTCRLDFQRKALEAVQKGLEEIKKRQKNLAILRWVQPSEIPDLLQKRITPNLVEGRIYQGIVIKTAPAPNNEVILQVAFSNKLKGRVRLNKSTASIYRVGQVLALRFEKYDQNVPEFTPDDKPKLQGALVCIENNNGSVRAIVGGSSLERFQFNRAIQARRQPGSAFKPIVYSVALEQKSYSPATIIIDEPIVVDVEGAEDEWEPRNSSGSFMGPMSFRRALELSRNICTIKILMDVGLGPVLDMAGRMGITSPLGRNLSLSLGTSEVTLFEITSAYTVFPNGGVHVEPIFVKRVEDRFGNVLEDHGEIPILESDPIKPVPREEFREFVEKAENKTSAVQGSPVQAFSKAGEKFQTRPVKASANNDVTNAEEDDRLTEPPRVKAVMSPQTAYIMTSLLQGGVRQGTGARMTQYLQRKDVAGKTGTTNNAEDTWFIGFNPDYTTGVWVGFDEKRPLGRREEGSRAAMPVWGYFMRDILKNKPEREFVIPPDIMFKELLTVVNNPKEGPSLAPVREPIYAPFNGYTLVISPLDSYQSLAEYIKAPLPLYTETGGMTAAPIAAQEPQPDVQPQPSVIPPGSFYGR
ncbi:MAG: penicillin-binding protein 1A [Desulfomonilaceae bacterium]